MTVLRGGFFVVRGRLGEETPCTVACHANSPDIFPLGTFVNKDEQGVYSNSYLINTVDRHQTDCDFEIACDCLIP